MKFQVGIGRYSSLASSRYQEYTYGSQGGIGNNIPDAPQHNGHGTYGALLFDKRWKLKREEILTRDGYKCVICKSENELQVHHRQYHFIRATQKFKAPWDYENRLMITLCERCHSKGHNKYKVPNVYL